MPNSHHVVVAALAAVCTGCVTVNQGEVGMRRTWGKIDQGPLEPGLVLIEPISQDVVKVPVRTTTLTVAFSLPSKEGLNISAQISILYRVKAESAIEVITTIGEDYEDQLIALVFRSAAADVSARFDAKDMYSAQRANIEREIKELMSVTLAPRGFIIEGVLMKSIELPPRLAAAIEGKLQAEQEAERMQFVLQRERLEAERKRLEAEGIRDSQKLIADGLTPLVIQWKSLEAFKKVAESPNTKVVMTNGTTPMLIGQ